MLRLKSNQLVRLKWSNAATLAIASVLLVVGITLQAQHEKSSGTLVKIAAATDAAPQVIIDNYSFNPASVTVKVGTTVTWINHDDDPHTVDSSQGKFKSAALNKGDKFVYRFSEAGEYPFYCRFHPKMTGKVVVQP